MDRRYINVLLHWMQRLNDVSETDISRGLGKAEREFLVELEGTEHVTAVPGSMGRARVKPEASSCAKPCPANRPATAPSRYCLTMVLAWFRPLEVTSSYDGRT